MRHQKKKVTLDRDSTSRRALLISLTKSLIEREKIITTQAKAKALRPIVEKLITKAKNGTLADRRAVFKILGDKIMLKKLFQKFAPRYQNRHGGYTRLVKIGTRLGDGAEQVIIELV